MINLSILITAEVCSKKPYTVTRSRNHMLPVYLKIKERKRREQTHGKRMLTVITKVGGDISVRSSLFIHCQYFLFDFILRNWVIHVNCFFARFIIRNSMH